MSLQIIIRENSLREKEDHYIFIIKAYVLKNIKHYEFMGKIILNEQGKVLKKEIEEPMLCEELVNEVFENEKIINYVKLVSWVIKSRNDLQKITKEDIQCVKKECKYISDNNHYVFICKIKNQPELKFRTVFSKDGGPVFYVKLKDEIETSYLVTNILTKNIKNTIINKIKYHSKEKVRLLTNGFYLYEKRNEESQ